MVTAIKSKQLIDGYGSAAIAGGVVLVEGERILAVGAPEAVSIPEGASIIDLSDQTVLPGLVDAHSHVVLRATTKTAAQQQLAGDAKLALIGASNIRQDLLSGVTTVRTLSDRDFVDVYVREAVEEGEIAGPRLVISTRALRTTHGWGSSAVVTNGVEEVRSAVRENLLWGADVIKLMITSWGGRDPARFQEGAFSMYPAFTREEIQTAVDEAHRYDKPVAAHLHGGPGLRWALEAGLDTVEHGGDVLEEELELFLKGGAWLVYTLTVLFHEMGLPRYELYSRSPFREQLLARQERVRKMVKIAFDAGVKLAIGTDGRHGLLHADAAYLVEFGLSPMDAIVIATKRGAEACRVDDKVGTLEKGKYADIISVHGDSLADIKALADIGMVMKGGVRYDGLSTL